MSHFWEHGRTKFLGNSDLSGDIRITNHQGHSIEVPGDDILEFVAQYVGRRRISELEQMDTNQILGIVSR